MTCELCNGTQLLPFKRKDGTIVANAFLDCSCKVDEPERDHVTSIDDFDFPLSQTFREFTFEQYGRSCERQREIYQPEEAPLQAPTQQPWDQRQQYQLDQTRAELRHIRQKLFEITGKKLEPGKAQQRPQPQRTGYKGLVMDK